MVSFLVALFCARCGIFVINCGSIRVKFSAKSSEDWESDSVLTLKMLLKGVGFIVLASAETDKFSIEKKIFAHNAKVGRQQCHE